MSAKKKISKTNNKEEAPSLVPTEIETMEENGPKVSLDGGEGLNAEGTIGAKKPTELPPPELAGVTAGFTAGTWERDKRVTALYNTHHTRNAWMNVPSIGWVRQATTHDSSCEAMNILAEHAKIKNSRIDFHLDGGKVTQMYVW